MGSQDNDMKVIEKKNNTAVGVLSDTSIFQLLSKSDLQKKQTVIYLGNLTPH